MQLKRAFFLHGVVLRPRLTMQAEEMIVDLGAPPTHPSLPSPRSAITLLRNYPRIVYILRMLER
jgi:hypothetical protein